MSLIEGRSSFHSVGMARLCDDDREMAWAEAHYKKAPDVKSFLASYIQASTPNAEHANSNGHIFSDGKELRDAISNLPLRPVNLLHNPGRRIGVVQAAEFVYPEGNPEGASEEAPIVEVLGTIWAHYEEELMASIEMAYRQGSLAVSMEAVPKSLTCKGKGEYAGCGETFDYRGRTSPTYCDHLNLPQSRKVLNAPMFTACAVILPPSRPGWKDASVKEMSRLIESEIETAEAAYNEIAAATPHLESVDHEKLMQWFLLATQGAK